MFTTKQRSNLRSLAQTIDPIAQIGKGGISDNLIRLSVGIESENDIVQDVKNALYESQK